jgi:DNA topoisomerase-2
MKIKSFLDKEFKSFSTYDCKTKLPSMVDGFKVSQRKIIHTAMDNNHRMKVEVLAPLTQSYTEYHHGANSLEGVIVRLAQDFVGCNNVNYLIPDGQFGNRLKPVASASRYIHVKGLNQEFFNIFQKSDSSIINHLYEDGKKIEPEFYLPILPAILINGADGIGTGFACTILCYNPADLKTAVIEAISGKTITPLTPWYKGFKGTITKTANQTVWTGVATVKSSTAILITELPIGYDQDSYREVLDTLQDRGIIRGYEDESRMGDFKFTVKVPSTFTAKPMPDILSELKLIKRESENITGWSYEKNKLVQFDTIEEYIKWWVDYRITKIDERRLMQLKEVDARVSWLETKLRFINFYMTVAESFSKLKKVEIKNLLTTQGFNVDDHDRLLDIKIYNLTEEQVEKLKIDIEAEKAEKIKIEASTPVQIFKDDLKTIK